MKKNIAFLIHSLAGGGAERVISNLSIAFPKEKYNVYIIVFDNSIRDYLYEGELIDLKSNVSKSFIGKLINFIYRITKLRKLKKNLNINTTISFLNSANLINILSKQKDKVIVSVRNYVSKDDKGLYGNIHKTLIKLLYNKADLVVPVSHVIKRDLLNNYGIKERKVKVIYNPYNLTKIMKYSKETLGEEYEDIFNNQTIVTVGSLTRQKGQWHLIRAFVEVKKVFPDTKLVILGQGELEDYLKQLAYDLGLERDAFFLGFQRNPFKYVARSTLFVFPSLYEGFPNALCEAMACGIPVISTDCKSGPREILTPDIGLNLKINNIVYGKYGILVPELNGIQFNHNDNLTVEEKILSECMLSILKDRKLLKHYSKMSIDGVKHFREEKIVKEWEEVI